jgi:hypothetical protein
MTPSVQAQGCDAGRASPKAQGWDLIVRSLTLASLLLRSAACLSIGFAANGSKSEIATERS